MFYLDYNITYLNNMAIPTSQLCHKNLWTNRTQMLHYSMWIITKICKILDVDSKDDYFHINNEIYPLLITGDIYHINISGRQIVSMGLNSMMNIERAYCVRVDVGLVFNLLGIRILRQCCISHVFHSVNIP